MPRIFFLIFFFVVSSAYSQVLTSDQQKALNAYVEYINYSVDHVHSNMIILKSLYEDGRLFKTKKMDNMRTSARFPDIEMYYLTNAGRRQDPLGSEGSVIHKHAEELDKKLREINLKCRALEVYLRLGDYQKDSLAYGEGLFKDLEELYKNFSKDKENLEQHILKVYRKLRPVNETGAYDKVEKEMLVVLQKDAQLLKEWNYNFREEIKNAWPIEKVQQNVTETEQIAERFKEVPAAIKMPESSSYKGFESAIQSSLSSKRDKIDNYNSEARKSGSHSNEAYLDFINHYNNDLVASYNDFVSYSTGNGYKLLLKAKFSPVFTIAPSEEDKEKVLVTFKDIPSTAINITPRPQAISSSVSGALNNYVDFINETLRQVKYLQLMLRNYNSSANYYKTSHSSDKARVTYTHENFKIPQTAFYKALNESKSIPAEYQKPLNDQHEVLMRILKELDALGIELDEHTNAFNYRDDNFKRSDEILTRCKELITLMDGKKEKLYNDINKIYYSYQPVTSNRPWYASVTALTKAVDLSKKQLNDSKDFLATKKNIAPSPMPLKEQSRKLIVEEYTNMDGIKRLGRSNGQCPYTPYENIAEATGKFADKIDNLKRGETKDNERSYEDLIYIYNGLIDDYNKFTDLNPLEDLRNIHQINVIEFPTVQPGPQLAESNVSKKEPEKKREEPQLAAAKKPTEEQIIKYDTVTIIKELKTEIVKRDTVFIEKSRTDTVYIHSQEDDEDLLSLEGYANNNIVLLLDVSSSMEAPHKLPLLKKSVKQLIQIYRPEDEISVVLYSGKAKVALEPTSGSEKEKILEVIDNLKSEGSTDANAGLRLAYKIADENYKRGGNNRVILATDGEFKVSGSSLKLVEGSSQNDIYLTVFNYTDQQNIIENLKKLSEKGKGNYENITFQNADIKMVKEAKAKKRADHN